MHWSNLQVRQAANVSTKLLQRNIGRSVLSERIEMPEPALSQEPRAALYTRAGGRCECRDTACGHPTERGRMERCTRPLTDWKVRHIMTGDDQSLSNMEALCWQCFEVMQSDHRQWVKGLKVP